MYQGRTDDARFSVALSHSNGDVTSPLVLAEFQHIEDTILFEKNAGETLSVKQLWKTRTARKRVMLAVSCAVFSTVAGNVAASYYLGPMLTNAGIVNTTTQLEIVSSSFCVFEGLEVLTQTEYYSQCLVSRLLSGWNMASRQSWTKTDCTFQSGSAHGVYFYDGCAYERLSPQSCPLSWTLLTPPFLVYGTSTNHSGIYAAVASIFLFQGAYSIGWTPILYLYPPEVLHYPIRANGMGVFQIFLNGTAYALPCPSHFPSLILA